MRGFLLGAILTIGITAIAQVVPEEENEPLPVLEPISTSTPLTLEMVKAVKQETREEAVLNELRLTNYYLRKIYEKD